MKNARLLCMVYLGAAVFYLATPANAVNAQAGNPVRPPYQQMVSGKAAVLPAKPVVENNSLPADASGISDEAWLFFSAMLALGGIFIVHRTAH